MKRVLIVFVLTAILIAPFSVTVRSADSNWFTDKEPVTDYAFSFALVGDTQYITLQAPEKLPMIYDFIIDHREEKKIAFVFGLGDITHTSTPAEWATAKESIERLNGIVPYSVIRGNHDKPQPFNQAFATEFYLSEQDGFYKEGEIDNVYRTFSVCGNDFLQLTLDYGPTNRILNWAEEIIEAHPNHRVIISTHGYLNKDGTTLDASDPYAPSGGDTSGIINNGDQIWEKLISKHENIFLVLSGHISSKNVIVTQTKGLHGNTVTQMLVDTQFLDQEEPAGNIVMLYFSNDGETVSIEQYSTIRKQYYMRESQREITVPRFSVNPPFFEATSEAESTTEDCSASSAELTEALPSKTGCHAVLTARGFGFVAVLPLLAAAPLVIVKRRRTSAGAD